jgi:hypothetical protein
MVKKQTWILLALFLALAGFAIYQKYNPKSETTDSEMTPSATDTPVEYLFPAEQGAVTSLMIKDHQGQIIGVERKNKAWVITQPFEAEASQATVEEAATQVTALTILNHLEIDLADVGLNDPAYTITVGFSDGKSMTAQVGDVTPTESGYYVRKNDGSILVISKYGMESLLNLILYPPYEQTPTPSPMPATQTATPPVPTETPSATETP